MKAFVASVVAVIAISIVAVFVLGAFDMSSQSTFSSPNTRPPAPMSE